LWDIVYVDEYSEPKKGELNKEFGLIVERPFYIVSQLGGRYIEIVDNTKPVIKTRNGN
jgi:hypothetical protein